MKLSEVNEYLQTLATLGAVLGLVVLGYEVRQSNRIATSELSSSIWSNWLDTSTALLESGVAEVRAKAMTSSEDLTLEDQINLDFWLQSWIYRHVHDLTASFYLGDPSGEQASILYEAATEAPRIFGSEFSRAWFLENTYWMPPLLADAIEDALNDSTVGADLEYYRRMASRATAVD